MDLTPDNIDEWIESQRRLRRLAFWTNAGALVVLTAGYLTTGTLGIVLMSIGVALVIAGRYFNGRLDL